MNPHEPIPPNRQLPHWLFHTIGVRCVGDVFVVIVIGDRASLDALYCLHPAPWGGIPESGAVPGDPSPLRCRAGWRVSATGAGAKGSARGGIGYGGGGRGSREEGQWGECREGGCSCDSTFKKIHKTT